MMISMTIGRPWRRRASRLGGARCASLLALLLLMTVPAFAADTVPPPGDRVEALVQAFPDGLTPGQLDSILTVMDDESVRAALRQRLLVETDRRRADAASSDETLLAYYGRQFDRIAAAYPTLPSAMADAFVRSHGRDAPISPVRLLLGLALVLGVGTGAMLLVRWIFAGRRRRLAVRQGMSRAQILSHQGLRLILDLIEIAVFVAGAVIAYVLLRPSHPAAPAILFVVVTAAIVVLAVERAAVFLCDPHQPNLRLIPIANGPARALHRNIVAILLLAVGSAAIVRMFGILGMAPSAVAALALPLSVIPVAYLVVLVWRHCSAITATIADRLRLDLQEAPFLGAWPVLASAYLAVLWMVVADAVIRQQPRAGARAIVSLLIVVAVPLLALLIQRPIARFYGGSVVGGSSTTDPPRSTDEYGDALPALPADSGPTDRVNRLMRAVWGVLIFLSVIVTARIWGYDPTQHEGIAGAAVRALFRAGVVLLLAYVCWALVVHWIDRTLAQSRRGSDTTRAHRLATLLPLFLKFLKIVLLFIVGMVILSSLGIEIGPLLAGAGVVGLAIGLGAQSTIANILAGVFFLLEDAFHLGDYIEVGDLRGTIEGISLRSLRLRHHLGAIHTVPFGQISALTNYTRDWALVRLEFRVPPDTDLALVKRLVKDIGMELSGDPELGPAFIEPLKSQGVRRVEDNALVIGIKYIAKPGQQFLIRREAYQRLIRAFNEHGIDLVGRGVVVKVEGADVANQAIGAAGAVDAEDSKAR